MNRLFSNSRLVDYKCASYLSARCNLQIRFSAFELKSGMDVFAMLWGMTVLKCWFGDLSSYVGVLDIDQLVDRPIPRRVGMVCSPFP